MTALDPGSQDAPAPTGMAKAVRRLLARLSAALGGGASDSRAQTPVPSRHAARPDRPDAVARAGLFLWAPIWLSCGIGAWFTLKSDPSPFAYAAGALVGALAAWTCLRAVHWAAVGRLSDAAAFWARNAGFAVALIATGWAMSGIRAHLADAPVMKYRYYGAIEGRVVAIDRSARDRYRLTLDQVVLVNTQTGRTPRRVRLSLPDGASLPKAGQRIMTTGHLGPPPGPAEPGGFDFRLAAYFDGLGGVGYTRTPVLTVEPAPTGRAMAMSRLRARASAGIADGIGGQEGAVAAALMTGDRSRIAEATNQSMRDSNLYHIVSISGLHMAMLAGFIYAALRLALVACQGGGLLPVGVAWHKVAALGALAASAVYLWMSGGGVATERAFLMVAVMLGAILADRRAISLRTVALAAMLILILNPQALLSPGFQMSFAATVALILTARPWARIAPRLHWLLRPAAMLVISSLVAGLATGPIAAAHFSRAAQYGLAANLLVVPVMGTLVMPAGVIAALLGPLGLAQPALWVMGLGTRWMLLVSDWIASLDGSVHAVPAPPAATLPLMCGGVLVAALVLRSKAGVMQRVAGALCLTAAVLGAGQWYLADRPAILIAPEGAAVGILTPAGRALSKPGNAFIADSWIAADGDTASAEAAAARPGWTGPRGVRSASVGGVYLVHLSGKTGRAALPQVCRPGVVVIADFAVGEASRTSVEAPDWSAGIEADKDGDDRASADAAKDRGRGGHTPQRAARLPRPDCTLFDLKSLRRTGTVAGRIVPDGVTWVTAQDVSGNRPWSQP